MPEHPEQPPASTHGVPLDQALAARAHAELAELADHWVDRLEGFDATGAGDVATEQRSLFQDAARRFIRNRAAMVSLVMLVVYVLLSIFVPIINSGEGTGQGDRDLLFEIADRTAEPGGWKHFISLEHPLGYDRQGRDQFTRVWLGGRISLAIAFSVALVILAVGVVYGSIAGYAGGAVDSGMMRVLDALYGLPYLPFAIILATIVREQVGDAQPLFYLVPALTITTWFTAARIMRGQMLSLKSNDYVEAARSSGAGPLRIVSRHVLPNTFGIMVVAIFLEVPGAILGEATLSFLGLGVAPPATSWGRLANEGYAAFKVQPLLVWVPGLLIASTVLFAVAVADGLRDAFDPRGRRD